MQQLAFPQYNIKLKTEQGQQFVFDVLRRKYLVLTPEEWVRQHVLHYLIEDRNFPQGLISIEKGVKVNQQAKRYDLLVYSRNATPLMLVECKAADVKINQDVFDQAFVYNLTIKAPYILLSNGLQNFCCKIDKEGKSEFLKTIPEYKEL